MPTARAFLAAGVVHGILYAVSGQNGTSALNTVEAYDPAMDTWTTVAPTPTASDVLAAGVINFKLDAVGGFFNRALNTVNAYNPTTNTWHAKASMPTARYFLAAGVVKNRLYAVGGCCDSSRNPLNTVEAFRQR